MLHSDSLVYPHPHTLITQRVLNHLPPNQSFFSNDPTRFYNSSNLVQPCHSNHFLPSYHHRQTQVQPDGLFIVVPTTHPMQPPPAPPVTNMQLHNSAKSCSFPAPKPKTSTKTILELLELPTTEEKKRAQRFITKAKYQKRKSKRARTRFKSVQRRHFIYASHV